MAEKNYDKVLKKDLIQQVQEAEKAYDEEKKEKENLKNEISQLTGLVNKLMEEVQASKQAPTPIATRDVYSSNRRVTVMNFLHSSYNLTDHDGRQLVRFEGFADTAKITVGNLETLTARYKRLFNDLTIKILDEDVADEFGYLEEYKKVYTEKDLVERIMSKDKNDFITELNKYPKKFKEAIIWEIASGMSKGKEGFQDYNKISILEEAFSVDFNKLRGVVEAEERIKK